MSRQAVAFMGSGAFMGCHAVNENARPPVGSGARFSGVRELRELFDQGVEVEGLGVGQLFEAFENGV